MCIRQRIDAIVLYEPIVLTSQLRLVNTPPLPSTAVSPLDIAFDAAGLGQFTGVSDGKVLNLRDGTSNPALEPICGIGLASSKKAGDLYITEAKSKCSSSPAPPLFHRHHPFSIPYSPIPLILNTSTRHMPSCFSEPSMQTTASLADSFTPALLSASLPMLILSSPPLLTPPAILGSGSPSATLADFDETVFAGIANLRIVGYKLLHFHTCRSLLS
ncbi:unnamed protein product [Dovyalis caffra]|uniref:Uncharacterized protein n=1 Tax=Dovyalis caffra TaxID=77055 RepID=A0AAV1RBG6_9ROSI|nr:unnamed protein product [Dovyalis caffra]